MNYYTIKDLEVLSGIKAHTIRIWEKRYGLLIPERTNTNIRFYTDKELRHLLNVSTLVKRGHKISKVANYGEQRIQDEILKLNKQSGSLSDYIDQLVIYVVNFDIENLDKLLDDLEEKLGFEKLISKLIFPLFQKIGIYWQIGSIFPAQEHLMSNIIRQRIISAIAKQEGSNINKTALFFLPENEMHELILLFGQYLAVKKGYRTLYLGQSVPYDDLKSLTGNSAIDVVVTVFVNAIEEEVLQTSIDKISQLFSSKTIVLSGHQILIHNPKLPENVHFVESTEGLLQYLN